MLSVSSILMPLLPLGPKPSPLSLSTTRRYLGLRGSAGEDSSMEVGPFGRDAATEPIIEGTARAGEAEGSASRLGQGYEAPRLRRLAFARPATADVSRGAAPATTQIAPRV